MKKLFKILSLIFTTIMLIFILSSIPNIFSIRQGELYIDVIKPIKQISGYFETLTNGEIFYYRIGTSKRSFLEVIPNYFKSSLFYLIISLFCGVFLGTISGLYLSGDKTTSLRNTLSLIGHIPDFILIIFLQVSTITFNNLIGIRLFRIASAGENIALLLPLTVLSLFPFIYMMRVVSIQTYYIKKQNYVLFAKAKGLENNYIFFKHILPGVFPVILAELPRVSGLLIANLFISERLFNIPGMTRFLFYILGQQSSPGINREIFFQGHVVVNILFGFGLLYFVAYFSIWLVIRLIKKVLYND